MKNFKTIILAILLLNVANSFSQRFTKPSKLYGVTQGTKNDSLLVMANDGLQKFVPRSVYLSGITSANDYLTSVTENAGLLTFNIPNQTNPTFNLDSFLATKSYLTTHQDLSSYLTFAQANSSYEPIKSSDDNFVTDAEKIVIGNTSGVNTGDQDLSSYYNNSNFGKTEIDALGLSYNSLSNKPFSSYFLPGGQTQVTNGFHFGSNVQFDDTVSFNGNNTVNFNAATAGISYNDLDDKPTNFVHSSGSINETITGAKTFDGSIIFEDEVYFDAATAGISYNDLDDMPTIPTNNNQLTNGANYIVTETPQVLSKSGDVISLSNGGGSVTVTTSSGGSSVTNTAFIQGAGRVYLYTDARWTIDSDDIYGFNKEDFTENAGTGTEPVVAWETRGVPIPPNYRLKKIYLSGRTNNSEVTNLEIRVYKRVRSSPSNEGVDHDSEMTNTEIYSGNWFDAGITYVGNSLENFDKEITLTDVSNTKISRANIYFKPVGTLSSTRYFYMSYTIELEYVAPW